MQDKFTSQSSGWTEHLFCKSFSYLTTNSPTGWKVCNYSPLQPSLISVFIALFFSDLMFYCFVLFVCCVVVDYSFIGIKGLVEEEYGERVRLLNITIRYVKKDRVTLLPYPFFIYKYYHQCLSIYLYICLTRM